MGAQLRNQEKQRERETREAELERIRRAEEHRMQTQRILDQQELERCEAQERMEQNERMREQMMERKSMIRAEELSVARDRLEKKKADNAAQNNAQREERRQAFLLREQGAEERRQRMLVALEQGKYAEEQERKRTEMFDEVARKAQERVQVLRARQVAEDDNVRRIQMQRAQENIIKSERFQLRQSRSSSSVQQQQRVNEYQRQLVKQKVDADTARAEKVKQDLAAMLLERKMAAISMKKKQDKIKASMGKKW